MTLRTKFFIIVAVVSAFILFVIVLFTRGEKETKTAVAPSATTPSAFVQGLPKTETPRPSPPPSVPLADVRVFVRSFAERFGSFSNESDFANVRDLRSLMTDAMQSWADRFLTDARKKAVKNAPYYGITTRVVQIPDVSLDANGTEGTALVKTQRRETKGKEAPRVFYQDLRVTVKKVGGEWRVDAAEWK